MGAAASGAAGAAAAAAIAQAISASGVLVRLEPAEFLRMLSRQPDPVIVTSLTGVFTRRHQYLTSYKGLAFYTRSEDPLELPANAELITAKSMWMPG